METSHKTDFLGHDAIFPLLFKMSIPAAISMIINALYNIVDTIFVGQGVGPIAIAALAIVFPLQMIVSSFAHAISLGAASITSRYLGKKDYKSAANVIGTAYSTVIIVTSIIILIVFIFMSPILTFFGASKTIIPYAKEYLNIVAVGFFFFSLSMCASNLVRSEGNAKSSMIGMIIGALLNTILDPLFIFGFNMGVKGAAIATVISQFISCIYFFSIYIQKKTHIPIKLSSLKIKWPLLSESIILGIPVFVQSTGMSILTLIINNSLGFYGGDNAITIYGMIFRLMSIIIMPILGIVQGFQPIAGYNYGARNFKRVKSSLRAAILISFSFSVIGFLFMMLMPKFCISLFFNDSVLIKSSAAVLRIIVLFLPLAAIQITGSTYFQAVGKPNESFILGLSRQFIVLIPLILIIPRFIGLNGIWISFPLSDFLATFLTIILLIREVRHLEIKHQELQTEKI